MTSLALSPSELSSKYPWAKHNSDQPSLCQRAKEDTLFMGVEHKEHSQQPVEHGSLGYLAEAVDFVSRDRVCKVLSV